MLHVMRPVVVLEKGYGLLEASAMLHVMRQYVQALGVQGWHDPHYFSSLLIRLVLTLTK
jgi:hypothetical protein